MFYNWHFIFIYNFILGRDEVVLKVDKFLERKKPPADSNIDFVQQLRLDPSGRLTALLFSPLASS